MNETPDQSSGPEETAKSETKPSRPAILKTLLDPDACRRVIAGIANPKPDSDKKLVRSAPGELEPLAEKIENYRQSARCPVKWDKMAGSGRVRFCERCRLQVYDLDTMKPAEADELVCQREGKPAETLFRRADGKFLTSDCPIGAARERKMVIAAEAGTGLLLVMIVVMAMTNRPGPNTSTLQTVQEPPSSTAASDKAGSVKPEDASGGYEPVTPVPPGTLGVGYSGKGITPKPVTAPESLPPGTVAVGATKLKESDSEPTPAQPGDGHTAAGYSPPDD